MKKLIYLTLAVAGLALLPACETERAVTTTTTTEETTLHPAGMTTAPVSETRTVRTY